MLQPLPRRRPKSLSRSVPPPIRGWNARDARDDMKPDEALLLDNWRPRASDVVTRNGYALHCDTEESGAVETIVEHSAGGYRQLLCAVNGKILNVSTATPASLGTGFSEDRWNTATMGGYTVFVNGTDTPQKWEGTTLSTAAYTGVTSTDLVDVMAFKRRLYLVEKDTQSFWYGATDAVQGSLTEFNLGATGGGIHGNLVTLGSISLDGGDGPDDYFVAVMSSGQLVVYTGSDPGSNFSRIGIFEMGAPLGRRCLIKAGPDLIAMTKGGFVSLLQTFPNGTMPPREALSGKIERAIIDAVDTAGNLNGWEALLYPLGEMLIFNVPVTAEVYRQFVWNPSTKAWSRFTGVNAYCWALFNDRPYFGGADGVVYQFDTGSSDAGEPIQTDAKTAWNYFGDRGRLKRWTAARPIFSAEGGVSLSLILNTDFEDRSPTSSLSSTSGVTPAIWDDAIWDQEIWAGGEEVAKEWQSITGIGYSASLRVQTNASGQTIKWNSTQYIFEPGGYL